LDIAALEQSLAEDLACLGLPMEPWVISREGVKDVVVIGGGMTGLSVAAALRLHGVANLSVLDRSPAGQEGPWVTTARMHTLRTAKVATGPALGIAALTYRRWHEARYGKASWNALERIDRQDWMAYLVWYRRVMAVPVENGAEVARIVPQPDGTIVLHVVRDGEGAQLRTRHLVLATGFDGFGGPAFPPFLRGLGRHLWRHTAEEIDFAALKGRRIGVVGFGASALDNASTALEAGAASVDFFVRRTDLPAVQKLAPLRGAGFSCGYPDLPDEWKLRLSGYEMRTQNPPPRHSIVRLLRHERLRLHLGCPVEAAREEGGAIVLATQRGEHGVDFLILATGFDQKADARPELAEILPHIRLWKDAHPEAAGHPLAASPYLDAGFAFQEKVPGACPSLRNIYCPTDASILSKGRLAVGVGNLSDATMTILRRIASSLFVEDRAAYFRLAEQNERREFDMAELAHIIA